MIDRSFWKGKRVFLTGHTGFKGSWASLWLTQLGAEVTGYALEPATEPSLFRAADLGRRMKSVIGDVRDAKLLADTMAAAKPEIVIHMAAQALVRPSFQDPIGTYATNVMGTVHVFEAARHTSSVRAILNVTSDKCYENREWPWGYRETDPMGGYDPYSSSKGCSELVTSAYRRSFFAGKGLASGRAGNVIGGGDWALDRLVPDCMRAMMAGEPIVVRNPGAVRPWQHVLEPVGGYLRLIENLWRNPEKFAEGWNFGPEASDARPVNWIADRLVAKWPAGPQGKARWHTPENLGAQPHEAFLLRLDCSKTHAVLGWEPRLRLEDALDWTVSWFRAFQAGESAAAITLAQIEQYEKISEKRA